jgi:hypothetical protein
MADPSSEPYPSKGREANDAQPLNAADDNGGPERYPSARKDDAVESIEPKTPQSRSPARARGDSSVNEGRLGPGADPVEGKR